MIKRVCEFQKCRVREIALRVLERNAYFAHPQNILLGMLADENQEMRRIAVDKILKIQCLSSISAARKQPEPSTQKEICQNSSIRCFKVPALDPQAKEFYELVNLNEKEISQPPALVSFDNDSILKMQEAPLCLQHPCHNQAIERHIKLVSEASLAVAGYKNRDGLI